MQGQQGTLAYMKPCLGKKTEPSINKIASSYSNSQIASSYETLWFENEKAKNSSQGNIKVIVEAFEILDAHLISENIVSFRRDRSFVRAALHRPGSFYQKTIFIYEGEVYIYEQKGEIMEANDGQ